MFFLGSSFLLTRVESELLSLMLSWPLGTGYLAPQPWTPLRVAEVRGEEADPGLPTEPRAAGPHSHLSLGAKP